jgi:anti-sigma factor RsiW
MEHDALGVHPAEPELHALLDDELGPEERVRIEGHLAACPACSQRLRNAQAMFARIESMPEMTVGHDLSRPVVRSLRGGSSRVPVLGVLGLQSLAAVALIWAAGDRLSRLLAPLAQVELPGPTLAGWATVLGALWAIRLPATGFQLDTAAWLPRLSESLPDLRPAPDWILWGLLALGAWMLINGLLLRAERERRTNGG